jgi:hypothetical protein
LYKNPHRKTSNLSVLDAIANSLIGGESLWDGFRFKGYDNSRLPLAGSSHARPYVTAVQGYDGFRALLLRLRLNPSLDDVWGFFSDSESGRAAQIFCSALDDFSDWSFIETRAGIVGRGPPGACAGDDVCVFQGARTPMLLRRPCSRFVHALTL